MQKDTKDSKFKAGNQEYIDIYSGRKQKKRKIAWKKIFFTVFFIFIGIVGGVLIYAYNILTSFNYEAPDEPQTSQENLENEDASSLINDNMVLNVLLLGTDSQSAGDGGRTDTILILSLDARNQKLKITSIMRDTWVKIPGYPSDRINAAYTHGGAKVTADTIKYNFGIKIDRYALVDFDDFEHIIDSIGGIDLELNRFEVNYVNKSCGNKRPLLRGSGLMHLNGKQALMHARNRDSIGSDYDRTERQRKVIMAIFEKGKTLNIGQVTQLVSTVLPMVTTNFKVSEITRLASKALTYFNFPVLQFRIPTDENVRDETIDSKMVLVINDMAKARNDLQQFIYK